MTSSPQLYVESTRYFFRFGKHLVLFVARLLKKLATILGFPIAEPLPVRIRR